MPCREEMGGCHQELPIPHKLPGIDPVAGGAKGRRRGVGRGGERKCEGEDVGGRREGEEFETEEDALLFLALILLREEVEEEEGQDGGTATEEDEVGLGRGRREAEGRGKRGVEVDGKEIQKEEEIKKVEEEYGGTT